MLNQLLDKIVCNGEENFWTKIVPLIIFGVIWLLGMIGRAVQSKAGKTGQQQVKPRPPRPRQRQADLDDFIKMVKSRYAQAKEEAKKAQQREYSEWTVSPAPPPTEPQISKPESKPIEHPVPPVPAMATTPVSQPASVYSQIPPEMPERLKEQMVEPKVPELQTIPAMPEKIPMGGLIEEHPVEMTAIEHHIYEQPVHKPYFPELMEQLTNADGQRKAFLFGEIFGNPIGLREI